MLRSLFRVSCTVACAMAVVQVAQGAVPSSENLFPSSTKGYLAVANIDEFEASWRKTQLGQLMSDPVMKPFEDDFREQLKKKWSAAHQKLGLTWDDLQGVPNGEVSIAVIEPAKGEHALALLVDVTGHDKEAAALLEKVSKNLSSQQARRSQREIHGAKVTLFDLPKKDDKPTRQVAFFLHDNMLGAADSLKVLENILGRFGGDSKDSLATQPAFHAVMERCHLAAGDVLPQIRWFIEPFGYADVVRAASPERHRRKGPDILKILKNQGFTAVQGIGGYVNLASTSMKSCIARPCMPRRSTKDPKSTTSRRGCSTSRTAASSSRRPGCRDLATHASFNLEIRKAFEASKSLVDEYMGEPVFEDILTSILTDQNGPQIDIRKDLIGLLGTKVTVLSDYRLPITPKSERLLVAVETDDPAKLAITIEKSMKNDPDARRREFNGHVIWEMVEQEAALPMVTIENQPAFGPAAPAEEENEDKDEPRLPPNSAVTVAHGQLMWATHIDLLIKILGATSETDKLSDSVDYKVVHAELLRVSGPENCAMTFSRTDEEYRALYELIKAGRMPEAETMMGKILNAVLGDGKQGSRRNQRIDGSKLPEYDAVRRYFGPAGIAITAETNGWFATGFTLSKVAPDDTVTAPATAATQP